MARIAEELGVEIKLEEEVKNIEFQGRRATAIVSERGRYECDATVINADFARSMMKLVPNSLRRRWKDQRIRKAQYSCSTFMMYLGLDGIYDELPHHNIYVSRNYTENLRDIEQRHSLSEDPSFYVQNACVTDASLAPKGQSTLYFLMPVTHESSHVDWSVETERCRNLAMRKLESLGMHDIEPRIRYEQVFTPVDWDQQFQLHLGATFSMAHTLKQMLHLRPNNRFEDVDGIYLVGGGTHPGSGLPVIFESARISSRLLLEDLGLEPMHRTLRTPREELAEAL